MESSNEDVVTLSNGDIVMWVVCGSTLHLKCVTPQGDPVELNATEVVRLCQVLHRFAKQIE